MSINVNKISRSSNSDYISQQPYNGKVEMESGNFLL